MIISFFYSIEKHFLDFYAEKLFFYPIINIYFIILSGNYWGLGIGPNPQSP